MSEPKGPLEDWCAIMSGDLGLQAAYWRDKDEKEIFFRPIVGWFRWTLKEEPAANDTRARSGINCLVISDEWFPTLAGKLPNYIGSVPKGISVQEITQRVKEARLAAGQADVQINVRGVGQA